MGKKISLGASITIALIVAALAFSLAMVISMKNFNEKVSSITERENMYSKFTEVDDYVRQYYPGEIDEDKLMDGVARGYLSGINDPYASYMDANAYQDYLAEQKIVSGVGISVTMDSNGYMLVNKVYTGSTAETAGIIKDDVIIKVDDIKLSTENYESAEKLLTGDAGTKVTLTVRRDNEDTDYEITRRNVVEDTISETKFGNMTYLHIDSIGSSTPEQFNKIVDTAVNESSPALLLDLRSTKGGSMDDAAKIVDKILGVCDMLSVEYTDGRQEILYSSNAKSTTIPIAILINENTSGPAEFIAGCLRDSGKAKIVGTRSAGVGSLQQVFKLKDGSAIKLSIGTYFFPATNQTWEQIGINPDFQTTLDYTFDYSDLSMIDLNLDTQLSKAIEVVSTSTENETVESGNTEN